MHLKICAKNSNALRRLFLGGLNSEKWILSRVIVWRNSNFWTESLFHVLKYSNKPYLDRSSNLALKIVLSRTAAISCNFIVQALFTVFIIFHNSLSTVRTAEKNYFDMPNGSNWFSVLTCKLVCNCLRAYTRLKCFVSVLKCVKMGQIRERT